MPTKSRRENTLIEWFLSAYDHNQWADAKHDWLDERQDGAVEVLVTRSDGLTLAIEHTLIEFFVGEGEDLERFRVFLRIEEDESLSVPGKIIYVNVPRGVLQKGQSWDRVVDGVHNWLRMNIRSLPAGPSMQTCQISAPGFRAVATDVILEVDVQIVADFEGKPPLIRRYGPTDVGETVEKALSAKLPKLVGTAADLRILLLERNQWTLPELAIHDELEKRRKTFPTMAKVNEVWLVETVTAASDLSGGYVEFKHYVSRKRAETIAFQDGKLFSRSTNGIPVAVL